MACAPTCAGLNVNPTPTTPPSSFSSSRVTSARPSERSASCHSPCPPSRTTATSTVVSCRLERSLVTHGSRPEAAASELRHTSPPTMQRPVRTVAITRSRTPDTATALTASRAATASSIATYSIDA